MGMWLPCGYSDGWVLSFLNLVIWEIFRIFGSMKEIISKMVFILREWIKQHHEMERVINRKKYE
jgi:hypothetical protein